MEKLSNFRPDLKNWNISKNDPGWVYIIKNVGLYKFGKTTNPKKRIQEARTWIPDLEVLAVKPFWNVSVIEHAMHQGMAEFWYDKEWFRIDDDLYECIIEGFQSFYDEDRDMNSVNFSYWYHGSGLSEFAAERADREERLLEFQRNESRHKRK